MIVAVVLVGEATARVVGPDIPRRSGSEERLLIKSDQIYQRGPHATDVIILGSSETAGGLVPSIVAQAAPQLGGIYNAGLSGSELLLMRQWAGRIVVPNLHPKVAVIGVLPMSVQRIKVKGGEGQKQAVRAYSTAIELVDPGGVGSLGWRLRQHSALIRYRPYLRSPSLALRGAGVALQGGRTVTAADLAADANMDWTTETDPRRVKRNTGPDGAIYDYRRPSIDTPRDDVGAAIYTVFAKSRTDFSELDALVTSLRARGVRPVIAVAPVDRGPLIAGGADLAPLDRVAGQIEEWGRRHQVAVNDQFTERWASPLFHDRNHLDQAGARRWSTLIGDWLTELCGTGQLGDACRS